MKIKSIMLLAVAVGCGLVAMLGVQQVLSGNRNQPVETEGVKIYVAAQEILPGELVDETMVRTETRPKDAVPEGAVTDPKQFHERAILVKTFPGDLILEAKLGEKGKFGAAATIPPGMRVVTLLVNSTQTHSGLMMPGDKVDVLVTFQARASGAAANGQVQKTKTVLENIVIFAMDNIRNAEGTGADGSKQNTGKTVSLLVTPDQAAMFHFASSKGTLSLALRNSSDNTPGNVHVVDEAIFDGAGISQGVVAKTEEEPTLRDFLKDNKAAEPAPPPVAAKKTWTITIYEKEKTRVEEVELPDDPAAETPASNGSAERETHESELTATST